MSLRSRFLRRMVLTCSCFHLRETLPYYENVFSICSFMENPKGILVRCAACDYISFKVISGIFLSTPHLSGIAAAAMLKSSYPLAALKYAIMTTAGLLNVEGKSRPLNGASAPQPKRKRQCSYEVSDCNNKIIGKRISREGIKFMPIPDEKWTWTHMASTAAGAFFKQSSRETTTERRDITLCTLRIYKVCSASGLCDNYDVVARKENSGGDGVVVIS
ncbi:hypothetical protein GIB67_019050 [Kingdonia uniflora]|uniref:Uncharacterized protein n=1 Tax=Kingdonia uniflora TaxID=39325 RepID=A0A7J7MZC5_9MAGN|nr:hypothetical protein GIB67_019050 [Kingdonia uniflora]